MKNFNSPMRKLYCVIPARKGSKRIPNKNLYQIGGIPILSLTISKLISSNHFQKVYVSSDSDEIIRIAEKSGALCPFTRPTNLADDFTSTLEVIKHALQKLNDISDTDIVICIYPTSVLLDATIFKNALEFFVQQNIFGNFLVSASKFRHPPQRAFSLSPKSKIQPLQPLPMQERTQDLEVLYFDAGQFYIAEKSTWLNSKSIFSNAYGYELPSYAFLDIDTPEDMDELKRRMLR